MATGQLWRFMLTVLAICCTADVGGGAAPVLERIASSKSALGKLVYLPTTDILGDLNAGFPLFTSQPESITAPFSRGGSSTRYFESSDAFRRQLSIDAGLGVSLASASLSLETTFNSISGWENDVSVAEAFAEAAVSVTYATNDVLDNLTLRPDFLASFGKLPVTIQNERQHQGWLEVQEFLHHWGTHVIEAAYTGATYKAYSSASSSRWYSQRQLEARACLRAGGLSRSVEACSGFSDSDLAEATHIEARDTRLAKGATAATRNRLLSQPVTADAIEAFLNEAGADEQPMRYRFLPLWTLLRRRFRPRSDDWRRATNLEAYYDGWLGFGCRLLMLKGERSTEEAQWFEFNRATGYAKCARRCLGCQHYYHDCHIYRGVCFCAGPSCLIPDNSRPGFHVQLQEDLRNGPAGYGCGWDRGYRACRCTYHNYESGCEQRLASNPNTLYRVIWDQSDAILRVADLMDVPPFAEVNATFATA